MSRWSMCALLAVAVLLTGGVLYSEQAGVKAGPGDSPAPSVAKAVKPAPVVHKGDGRIFVKTRIVAVPKKVAPPKGLGTGEAAIEKALESPTQMEFVEQPLDQVVDYLRDYHQIEIQLDKSAMEDVGIAVDHPVTQKFQGLSLRSALRLMLRELKLTYTIQNDVLLITTPEVEEANLVTRVYDVADLVVCIDDKLGRVDDYDSLIDALTSTIYSSTWDAVGGPGSIFGKSFGTAKVLVVSQTYEIHAKIADLLKEIRAVAAKHSGEGLPRRERAEQMAQVCGSSSGTSSGQQQPATGNAAQPHGSGGGMFSVPRK